TLALGRFLWRYFIFGSSRGIEYKLRNDMFGHLEKLSSRYFNEHKTGDLMAHFTNDLNAIRMTVGPAIITAFDAIIMTIMVLAKMVLHIDLQLTLLAVIPLLTIAIGCYYFGKEIEKRYTAKQEAFSALSDQVQESLTGIRVIKAFVQEHKELAAFARSNKQNMDKNLHVVKLHAMFIPLLDGIIGISTLITLLYGGYLAITGGISLGQFIAFNQYLGMLVWPMIACGDCINNFSQGRASARRVQAIFDEKPEIFDEANLAPVSSLDGSISFQDLTFTYPGSQYPALNHISIEVASGETLAILGRTGSGKTTFANLLLRLYNTESGQLSLSGTEIRRIPLNVLRENIAYVPQDNFLFSSTLEENIAFGVKGCPSEAVIEAAKAACIHDNIVDFPDGYQTMVGERGVTLSGGQKQRSSIARALMKDAPLLILDDSLSAVDTDTEEQILSNLKENRAGKTTIIIAHRISTIQNADHILVLEDGNMAEYGTHEELMARRGIYHDMYEKQQLEKQLDAI
ncbi:MAG: ABC transporter ATP-binding protein, partial [Lachnospiraceae bacterium]|nr:ABC transporter ATP-binding protein [Lachnospiraceae bacterium]